MKITFWKKKLFERRKKGLLSGILTKTLEGFLYFSRRNGLKDLIRKPLSLEE